MRVTVQDVYKCIDSFAPFSTQEKWDNSGLLIGTGGMTVKGVQVSLDISPTAVEKAQEYGCNLLVSHHPVIFSPLKTLDFYTVPYQMAVYGMSAICNHTPLDIAEGGINDLLVEKLWNALDFSGQAEPLDKDGCGRLVTLNREYSVDEIAVAAKRALGCSVVRCSTVKEITAQTLGICSGSGASMLEDIADRCDCLLTGDVKHDRWYKAEELGMGLIDCGHYHTEIIMVPYVARKLRAAFPELRVVEFMEGDPVAYV